MKTLFLILALIVVSMIASSLAFDAGKKDGEGNTYREAVKAIDIVFMNVEPLVSEVSKKRFEEMRKIFETKIKTGKPGAGSLINLSEGLNFGNENGQEKQ
ncbi:MAG: hypothetical protein V4672_10035 [Verrucomicrobiota bacterium]